MVYIYIYICFCGLVNPTHVCCVSGLPQAFFVWDIPFEKQVCVCVWSKLTMFVNAS